MLYITPLSVRPGAIFQEAFISAGVTAFEKRARVPCQTIFHGESPQTTGEMRIALGCVGGWCDKPGR